jgi:hypothetical protein
MHELLKCHVPSADNPGKSKTGRAPKITSQVIINMIYVPCTRCNQPIDVSDPRTYLLRTGKLVRIRCREEGCLTADWYNEAEFEGQPERSPQTELPNPGLTESKTHWYDLLTSSV